MDSTLERSSALEIRPQRPKNLVRCTFNIEHSGNSGNSLHFCFWKKEKRNNSTTIKIRPGFCSFKATAWQEEVINMKWKKAVLFGILIWILMFAIVSAFIAFKIYYPYLWARIFLALISGTISFILAGYLKPKKASVALVYGIIFLAVGVILDALITIRFNPAIFGTRSLWLGYFLVLIAPLLRIKKTPRAIPCPK